MIKTFKFSKTIAVKSVHGAAIITVIVSRTVFETRVTAYRQKNVVLPMY